MTYTLLPADFFSERLSDLTYEALICPQKKPTHTQSAKVEILIINTAHINKWQQVAHKISVKLNPMPVIA
jgi:hypothetical protein